MNGMGRMVEAYTVSGTTCSTDKITDLRYSYKYDTNLHQFDTDVYELALGSEGYYYHTSASHWPTGQVAQLSGNLGLPAITFGYDGQGRISTVSDGSGHGPVTGTAYCPYVACGTIGPPPPTFVVTLGSGATDQVWSDAKTGRPSQYMFITGSSAMTGTFHWNPNGTLMSLTDPVGGQCNYVHDEFGRAKSVNCTSTSGSSTLWSQTFSFDPFGNITKSGTEFPANYLHTDNSVNNRIVSVGGLPASYDGNGNLTSIWQSDGHHTYSWDVENRAVLVDGVSVTYDALGRAMGITNGSNGEQVVYGPDGGKLAIMNSQTQMLMRRLYWAARRNQGGVPGRHFQWSRLLSPSGLAGQRAEYISRLAEHQRHRGLCALWRGLQLEWHAGPLVHGPGSGHHPESLRHGIPALFARSGPLDFARPGGPERSIVC